MPYQPRNSGGGTSLPATLNLLAGDGAGGAISSGIDPTLPELDTLGIGETALEKLQVAGAIRSTSNATDFSSADGINVDYVAASKLGRVAAYSADETAQLVFYTGHASEAMRIGATGKLTLAGDLWMAGYSNSSALIAPYNGTVYTNGYWYFGGQVHSDTSIDTTGNLAGGSLTIGGGTAITKVLSATATLDFPSTDPNTFSELSMTVTGAVDGDCVVVRPVNSSSPWGLTDYDAYILSADTVRVRFNNNDPSNTRDPASGVFRAIVFQF